MSNLTASVAMSLTPHGSNAAAQCSPVRRCGRTGELPAVNLIVCV